MDAEWLDELEARVEAASEELRRLREENSGLQEKVEELSGELEEARAAASEGGDPEAAQGWEEEKGEIRRRVEALAENLETLLEEDDG